MLKNNVERDIKIKCLEAGLTQGELGKKIGTSGQYVNRVIKRNVIVNRTFIKMMEGLGYDVELHYVKRDERF